MTTTNFIYEKKRERERGGLQKKNKKPTLSLKATAVFTSKEAEGCLGLKRWLQVELNKQKLTHQRKVTQMTVPFARILQLQREREREREGERERVRERERDCEREKERERRERERDTHTHAHTKVT